MKLYGLAPDAAARAFREGRVTVAVYGLGKMGLPLAVAYADGGARVIGVDISPEVVRAVNAGLSHVEGEPGVPEAVARHVPAGTLRATDDPVAAAREADVMVIIVPTLLTPENAPDLSAVETVARNIAKGLKPGDLVIQESTVPPGTTDGVLRRALEEGSGLKAGRDFGLAYCPERTASGRALRDIRGAYPKVVGGYDPKSADAAEGLYAAINERGVVRMSDARAAEAVKVFEGVYRDVNIALANELALVCESLGIDAHEVIRAANSQPYSHIHQPGCGVGGHCIPVYPYFVMGRTAGGSTPLLATARRINDAMPEHVVDLLERELSSRGAGLKGARVLVMGLTYRPGVRETRFAPSLRIVRTLRERGALVSTYDPLGVSAPDATPVAADALAGAWSGIVVATEDAAFRALPWEDIRAAARHAVLVDGRASLDAERLRAAGFRVLAVGRGGADRGVA